MFADFACNLHFIIIYICARLHFDSMIFTFAMCVILLHIYIYVTCFIVDIYAY